MPPVKDRKISASNSNKILVPKAAQLNGREMVFLQLAPGVVSVSAYIIFAWFLGKAGLPTILALMLAVPLAEVPFTWWLLVRRLRQETGQGFSFKAAFPWWTKIPWWVYLVAVPLIFLNLGFMMVGLTQIDPYLISNFFSWVPGWMLMGGFDPGIFSTMSRGVLLTMWGLSLFGMTILGGFTQELYSRGFLLPRMAHLGWKAPFINAALFAVLHFVAPWAWPVFFFNALIWSLMVYWRRSAKIGIFMHVGMLFLQWLGMTMVIFGFVPPPGGM